MFSGLRKGGYLLQIQVNLCHNFYVLNRSCNGVEMDELDWNLGIVWCVQKSQYQGCFISNIIKFNFNSDLNTSNFRLWREMVQFYLLAMILFLFHVMGAHGVILFVEWSCQMSLTLSQSNVYISMWLFEAFKVLSQVNWCVLWTFCYFDNTPHNCTFYTLFHTVLFWWCCCCFHVYEPQNSNNIHTKSSNQFKIQQFRWEIQVPLSW